MLCHPSDVAPKPPERERWAAFFEPSGDDPSNLSRYFLDLSLWRFAAVRVGVTDWLDAGHSATVAHGYDLGDEDGVVFGWNIGVAPMVRRGRHLGRLPLTGPAALRGHGGSGTVGVGACL